MLRALLTCLLLAPAVPAGDTFVYVHDRTLNSKVHAFALDQKTGELDALPGSPFDATDDGGNCGGLCQTMDVARLGKTRYLLAGGQEGVTAFELGQDGVPSQVDFAVGGAGDWLGVTTLKRSGKVFVYANEYDGNQVHGFELQQGGVLVELPGSPWATGTGPDGIDSGKDLVVCMNEDVGSLSAFKVQKDGSLVEVPGSPFSFPTGFSYNVQVEKSGRYVYAADSDADIFAFKAGKPDGALAALPGMPFDCGLDGQGSGLAHGRKPWMVAVDGGIDAADAVRLQLLRRKGNGSLDLVGEPQPAGVGFIDVHGITPNGRWLLVASDDTDSIQALRVKSKTGALEPGEVQAALFGNINALVVVDL